MPESCGVVFVRAGEPVAVRAEGQGVDVVMVIGERFEKSAIANAKNANAFAAAGCGCSSKEVLDYFAKRLFVAATGGDVAAIGAEGEGVYVSMVLNERPHEFSGGNAPKSNGAVVTACGEQLAIGTEGEINDGFRVPGES